MCVCVCVTGLKLGGVQVICIEAPTKYCTKKKKSKAVQGFILDHSLIIICHGGELWWWGLETASHIASIVKNQTAMDAAS